MVLNEVGVFKKAVIQPVYCKTLAEELEKITNKDISSTVSEKGRNINSLEQLQTNNINTTGK
jgi:hypothetical protein